MKKISFFALCLFYFGCSSEPEADYISEEILAGSRTSNSANDIRFTCSDLDNDDYCDDDDYWPLDPDMNENLWGMINDSEPNFYFTYDIDETVQEATISSMLGAMDEFGNWGPIELWVIGQDYEGVQMKAKNFCKTGLKRNYTSTFY